MAHYQKIINYDFEEAYHFLNKLPEYGCSNFENGCKKIYNSAMECIDHVKENCEFTRVNCPYIACSENMPIIDIAYHLKTSHPELFWEMVDGTKINYYNIICKDCKEVVLKQVHPIHFDTGYNKKDFSSYLDQECEYHAKNCAFRKVNCPYTSCSEEVLIKDVTEHMDNDHPETLWRKSQNNFGIALDMKFLGENEDQSWPVLSIRTPEDKTFFTATKIIDNNLYFWLNLFGGKQTAANYEVSYTVRTRENKIFGKVDKVHTLDEKPDDIINNQAAFVISKDQILQRCLNKKNDLVIAINITDLRSYVIDEYEFDCDGYHPRLEKPRPQVLFLKSQKLFLKKDTQEKIVDEKSAGPEFQEKQLRPKIWAGTVPKTLRLRFWIKDLLFDLYGDEEDVFEDQFE